MSQVAAGGEAGGRGTPGDALPTVKHDYLSTYCLHHKHVDCRKTCKICQARCRCDCHAGLRRKTRLELVEIFERWGVFDAYLLDSIDGWIASRDQELGVHLLDLGPDHA